MFDRTKFLNEGAKAGLDGLPADICPYPVGSPEHMLWIEGWKCATGSVAAPSADIEDIAIAA
ncbi:ribosome modulation factor [Enterovirga aerilata]|uniref:Uncharacterized protein n=1 Tax=Enterovirga aerilata TaxID=2730920 RepID=A0A849HWS9_9HYPH|nr:Rmf/CrpP family protein [Enterovirga sp. DB1703]NNM71562.1 hypothetical protein [Enterovirga sp. DB1703]